MRNLTVGLFTGGDHTDINTWSGLPYYFYKGLLAHNVQVNPVNLVPSEHIVYSLLCHLTDVRERIQYRLLRTVPNYGLFRTTTYYSLVNRKINAAMQRHTDGDLNVFLTFSFSSRNWSNVPVVHYCDRTYEHYLEDVGRKPTRRDALFIEIDRQNVESADLVLTTCPLGRDFITTRYSPKRIAYLKGGINADVSDLDVHTLIAQKGDSRDILFVGRGAYRRGADILIRAFEIFNRRHVEQFTLHMVGVSPDELPPELRRSRSDVKFYSYLDRARVADRNVYNKLMKHARLFVLPMRPGPLPNVIQEAQYYSTPVIISNVSNAWESVSHGHNGIVVDALEPEAFASAMDLLVRNADKWRQLAHAAHDSVKTHTWSNTIGNFLDIVTASGIVKRSSRRISA